MLKTHKEQIELFFLPPYSSELNADEYPNANLEQKIRSGLLARSEKELDKKTRPFMKTLQNRPEYVQAYFEHPLVAYAV